MDTQLVNPTPIPQQARRLASAFRDGFGAAPTHLAAAPGRVNLIGEHTDYNDGLVLPMAIEFQAIAAARPCDASIGAGTIEIRSTAEGMTDASFPADVIEPGEATWVNYVKGVIAACRDAGVAPPAGGLQLMVDTTVPVGGGLSSSASLEVSVATVLEAMAGRSLGPEAKAKACQRAEHEFAGVPCGIMDQSISAMARSGAALLLDCRTLEARPIAMDDPGVAVLIINSEVKHALTGGEYAERRAQCEMAAKAMGVASLRDATEAMLADHAASMEPVLVKRARHVIGEIARTAAAAEAAASRDWSRFGERMHASHASLRDDYEVSCPELDALVDAAMAIGVDGGVWGSRMTGGGFGGCTVSLVDASRAETIATQVLSAYREAIATDKGLAYVSRPAAGARVLDASALGD